MFTTLLTKTKTILAIGGTTLFLAACQTAAPPGGGGPGMIGPGSRIDPGQLGGGLTLCQRVPSACAIDPSDLADAFGGGSGGGSGGSSSAGSYPFYPGVTPGPRVPSDIADAITPRRIDPSALGNW